MSANWLKIQPMKKSLLTVLFFLVFHSYFSAQINPHGQCGYLAPHSEVDRLLKNKALIQANGNPEGNTNYIPIQFHIVGTNGGTGYIKLEEVFEGLCKLNEDFADTNLQFYFNGNFNYINMSAMYDLEFPQVPSSVNAEYANNAVDDAIDIFIGNGLSSGNSGYYTSGLDIIYMDKTYINSVDNILAHEMGHYFSLMHPFFGWENTEYDPDNPTPTTVIYFGQTYNVEYVDRAINCEDSGDYLCGTPADYIWDWDGGCNYTGGAVDPDSVLIDPDEANFMGYYSFSGCLDYFFSDDQKDVMSMDYQNRPEINQISPPNLVPINETTTNVTPPIDSLIEIYSNVELEWEPVPNATHYLLQVSRLSSFFFMEEEVLLTGTNFTATNLAKNKDYYWRVYAMNHAATCTLTASEKFTFSTGDAEPVSIKNIDIEKLEISISPNPTSKNSSAINVWLEKSLQDVQLEIFDINGKMIFEKNIEQLNSGWSSLLIENEVNFQNGVYLITFKNQDILQTEKLVVY